MEIPRLTIQPHFSINNNLVEKIKLVIDNREVYFEPEFELQPNSELLLKSINISEDNKFDDKFLSKVKKYFKENNVEEQLFTFILMSSNHKNFIKIIQEKYIINLPSFINDNNINNEKF